MIVLDAYGQEHHLEDRFSQDFEIPLRWLRPWGNSRMHWSTESRRKTEQKTAVLRGLTAQGVPPRVPCTVVLHRVTHRGQLDDDNVPDAMKYIRDTVCKWMGLPSDRVRGLKFMYGQQRTKRPGYVGVRVTIIEGVALTIKPKGI